MLWMAAESTISVTYKIIDGVRVRVSHAGSDYAYFDCCVLASSYHSQLLHWPKACHSEAKQEAVGAPVLTFVHSIITCFLTRLLELVRVALLYCDALDGLWATLVVS